MKTNKNWNTKITSMIEDWKNICKERNYTLSTKMKTATFISALGEVYAMVEGTTNKQKERDFIDAILEDETVFTTLQGINNKNFIETCIQAGIYKIAFLNSVKPIYENSHMSQEEKEEAYYKEYVRQNRESLYELEKVMGLCFVVEKPFEIVVDTLSLYEEDLEDTYDYWVNDEDEDF